MVYLALLRKGEGTDYCVDFPDLPGCVSTGETLEQAQANAVEALALHLEGMLEEQLELPEPRGLEAVTSDPDNRDAVVMLVRAEIDRRRTARINVTLPHDVLEQIDAHVRAIGGSRSAFLVDAARAQIRQR